MVSPIQVTDIAHFRAPYKDAYLGAALGKAVFSQDYEQSAQGYGVYEGRGVGDEADAAAVAEGRALQRNLQGGWGAGRGGLLAMWGQNPWTNVPGGRGRGKGRRMQQGVNGYGSNAQRWEDNELSGYGSNAARWEENDLNGYGSGAARWADNEMSGYGRGGPADAMLHPGFGTIETPALDVPIKALDPYFTIVSGITFATPSTSQNLDATLTQWGAADPSFAVPDATGRTVTIVSYHGMAQPPAGAEPGPYKSFAEVYNLVAPALRQAFQNHVMTIVDKQYATPTPGRRTMVLTADPDVVAMLTQSGAGYFLTQDEADPQLLAQSRLALSRVPRVQTASMFSTPFGLALGLAAAAGAVYFMFGKKKRKAA